MIMAHRFSNDSKKNSAMKSIYFHDPRSLAVYNQYLSRTQKITGQLSPAERISMLTDRMLIHGIIAERLDCRGEEDEFAAITRITLELTASGDLIPFVDGKSASKGEVAVFGQPFRRESSRTGTFRKAVNYMLFGLLYCAVALVAAIGVAKLFDTGRPGSPLSLGIVGEVSISVVLVNWAILLSALAAYRLLFAISQEKPSSKIIHKITTQMKITMQMKRNKILSTLIFTLLVSFQGSAQVVDVQKLDRLFSHIAANNRAIGSVAVSKGGELVYGRNFGQGNLGQVADSVGQIAYHIGSVTKMLTATMVFQLSDRGKISLSDRLSKYFPDFPNADTITLMHLLSHSSGLGDYLTKRDSLSRWLVHPVATGQLLSEMKGQGARFQPGQRVLYSNTGYYLLARILEMEYKKPYGDILRQQLGKPLKLKATVSMPVNVKSDPAAAPYRLQGQWKLTEDLYFANVIGVGDVISAPAELNRIVNALFTGGLVSPSSLALMKGAARQSFGAGLMQVPYFGKTLYGHGGDTFGSHSLTVFNPADSLTVSVSLNGQVYPANNIMIALLDQIYLKDSPLPNFASYSVDPAALESYLGEYASEAMRVKIKIFKEKGVLMAQAAGQTAFELQPVAKDRFERSAIGLRIEFRLATNQMVFSQRDKQFTLTRSAN